MSAKNIAQQYWELMRTNDFSSVGVVLSDDFVLEWPQSHERIRGRANFAAMNSEYPAHGRWKFTINRIVAEGDQAVTDVSVTDGVQNGRAISFFTIRDGKVVRMVEYWPDPFEPVADRRHLVEIYTSDQP